MSALIEQNTSYQAVKIIRVDWDQHAKSDIVNELGVTGRSTLITFNNGAEVARVVSDTSEEGIGAIFEAAIAQ